MPSIFDLLKGVQAAPSFSPGQKQAMDLNDVGTGLEAGGQIVGAMSHYDFGEQANRASAYQAAQLRINAGQSQASAQRQAYLSDRQTQLVVSKALANAAARGGGASDPGEGGKLKCSSPRA